MLVIENYKKLIGLKFGEWHCGLAEEHDPLYRFHFREGDIPNLGWKRTFWIEVERNVFTDSDGDRVISLNYPNIKRKNIMSLNWMKDLHNITSNFTNIIKNNAGQ